MIPLAILFIASSGAATLALGAGVLNGSFATPVRFMNRWKWENVWALWAVVAMLILPWTVALITVPHLFATYQGEEVRHALLLVIAFGAGYGIAAICFGLGVEAIGIALNFAIALGTATAVGSAPAPGAGAPGAGGTVAGKGRRVATRRRQRRPVPNDRRQDDRRAAPPDSWTALGFVVAREG